MIGKKIYEIRKQKKLTLSELAGRANISKSYLSNIERNLNKNPSIQVLTKLALVLDVDLITLLNTNTLEETLPTNQPLDKDWLDLVNEFRKSGVEKEQIQEYRTLFEFIKWKNEN